MTTVHELLALLDGPLGAEGYDEVVSQRAHALQCADLAVAEGAPPELVAAALLHDIGHLLVLAEGERPMTDDHHEALGARAIRDTLGAAVAAPVALHVAAKRYLCTAEGDYSNNLSAGSVASLELQGGPMSSDEAGRFRTRSGWEAAVRLRRWDDAAKVLDAKTSEVADFVPLLEGLVRT